MFDKPEIPMLVSAGMARDWPDGRGVWHNNEKTLLVWVNKKDHARVISMEKGGNMKAVFERFCEGLEQVEKSVKKQGFDFMRNDHLGYIATCPSDLGTGMRAGNCNDKNKINSLTVDQALHKTQTRYTVDFPLLL